MHWLSVGPIGFTCWIFFCSGIQFYLRLSPYLCFISLLYHYFYVPGDDVCLSVSSCVCLSVLLSVCSSAFVVTLTESF